MSDVTLILERIDRGDSGAARELLPLVYAELRRIAAAKLQLESAQMTLQPTALVHEAWLRLGGDEQSAWSDRRHFVGAAALLAPALNAAREAVGTTAHITQAVQRELTEAMTEAGASDKNTAPVR